VLAAIEQGNCPGGVLWLEHRGESYHKAFGRRAIGPDQPMTEDTVFDIASLTKVVATTPAIMKLVELHKIDLDAPACRYFPEFVGQGRKQITILQLLTHTSGLRADFGPEEAWEGTPGAFAKLCQESLINPPGSTFTYSDLNFVLLGAIIEKVSGASLDVYCQETIFRPLGMIHTCFRPEPNSNIAPTSSAESGLAPGIVHDPTARRMGGIAGHAGVFSTASDLARYSRMLLNGGEIDGFRLLESKTVTLMTSPQTPTTMASIRGLGWDIQSAYSAPKGTGFSASSYGHTGWTGCSMWLDPPSQTFVLFLSNRTYPNNTGNVVELRRSIGTLAAQAAGQ
jgi:CubicO group peptidase (beta-lactamase class C family)